MQKKRWNRTRAAALSLSELEIRAVHKTAQPIRYAAVRHSAICINWCANGLLYPLLAVIYVTAFANQSLDPLLIALASVSLAHCLYPIVKRTTKRPRPFELDPRLDPHIAPLDKYAFPSGHAMTLSATGAPFVYYFSETGWLLALLWIVVGWARIVVAHHFPTDILAGTFLGLATTTIVIQFHSLL